MIAVRPTATIEENKVIGTYLMTQLTSPPPPTTLAPEMMVAVLNAVIDIYADERRDFDGPVFVSGGFLQALTGVVAKIRTDVGLIC